MDEPFVPLSMDWFWTRKYWAIHEAVFGLTGWPKYNLFMAYFSDLAPDIQQDRDFFYLPERNFDPKHYSKGFQEMYADLKRSIEMGSLSYSTHYIIPGISILVSPQEVLSWAIRKGIYFQEDLQNASGIYLIDKKMTKGVQNTIKNKIVGQFLLFEKDIRSVNKLARDELIVQFGTGDPNRAPKAIVEDLNALYEEKGKPGVKLRPAYVPKAIPEIQFTDASGRIRYHYHSLELALKILLKCFLFRKGDGDLRHGADRYINYPNIGPILDEFMNLSIVKLYLDKAPYIIQNLSFLNCSGIFSEYGMYTPTYLKRQFESLNISWKVRIVN